DPVRMALSARLSRRPPGHVRIAPHTTDERGIRAPGRVRGAGPVATLAADVDRRPGRPKRIGRRIIAFANSGRMAVGAGVVPVLLPTGPVEFIAGRSVPGIHLEPSLTAGGRGAGV